MVDCIETMEPATVSKTKKQQDNEQGSTPVNIQQGSPGNNSPGEQLEASSIVGKTSTTAGEARHQLAEMRRNPDAIRDLFLSGRYPYQSKMPTEEYERKKKELQVELLKVQRWVKENGN
jgi:hypothetical protein